MPSADGAPVSDGEAAILFAPLRDRAGIALAVSGGADSSALLLLYARARAVDPRLPPATVLTVDHRLRPEAAAEARFVATRAAALGLPHHTLLRDGDALAGNLQAEARRARYRLLSDTAHDLGLDTLVTAHHAEDQAETFLARLARGSGVVGLSAMAPLRMLDGLLLARPLLDLPKARLAATLAAAGETWCEDPSNRDPRYDRVRLRAAAGSLAELGLTRDRLVATAKAMAAVAGEIDRRAEAILDQDGRLHPAGWASISAHRFGWEDGETRRRLIGRLIQAIGGADHAPGRDAVEAVEAALTTGGAKADMAGRSLGGTRVEKRDCRIWISPEAGRGGAPRLRLAPGGVARWRGRRVRLDGTAPGPVEVTALGMEGRLALREASATRAIDLGWPMPAAGVIETAPAIFVAGALVACPGLGYEVDGSTRWSDLVRFAPIETAFAATGVGSRDVR